MTRNNFITIDLRTLTNDQIYLLNIYDIVDVSTEIKARGFETISELHFSARYNDFGIYPTLDEYLSTFPQSQDNRTDVGC